MTEEDNTARCWICLEDDEAQIGMIAPCACTGTNMWVHESCLKTYCLQFLASRSSSSSSLNVPCPICRTDYQITATADQPSSSATSWRDIFRFSGTDQQLLLRHLRFFFLVAPLMGTSCMAWVWLYDYWTDLYQNGSGPPLMDGPLEIPSELSHGPPWIKGALMWLPVRTRLSLRMPLSLPISCSPYVYARALAPLPRFC